ncbi:MAG: hypothetical protein LBC98_05715 [Prevotellaceae bacterium]|jgi:hypothetical protein|nr:hypothetical protein [Prevotellaceae bacterium]
MKRFWSYYWFCLASIAFAACSKSEPVYQYINEPAMVTVKGSDTVLRIADGIVYAPGQLKALKPGDCLMAYFTVDLGNQPVANQTHLQNLSYDTIGKNPVRIISGPMQSVFNDSIEEAAMYKRSFDSVLFFIFEHKRFDYHYTYEIICNTDSIETRVNGIDIPKLYIRTKLHGNTLSNRKHINCAFDMSAFAKAYVNPSTKEVNLYLQYKTATKGGSDVYKKFQTYPIKWNP